MTDLEKAKLAEREARAALAAARGSQDAAVALVRAHHGPLIESARVRASEAARAHLAAQSQATPDHPWEGKTVTGPKGSWDLDSRTTVTGTVFTFRPGTDLGRGHTYSRPDVGDAYVRVHKKDGKPGSSSVRLTENFSLVEATT